MRLREPRAPRRPDLAGRGHHHGRSRAPRRPARHRGAVPPPARSRGVPPAGQTERFQAPQPGGYFTDGSELDGAGTGTQVGGQPYGRQRPGERSSALGLAPLGHPARLSDSVFTMLEVDRMVERYEFSAAPIYPPALSAMGKQGQVHATFVVDTTGQVDMASVQVLASNDPSSPSRSAPRSARCGSGRPRGAARSCGSWWSSGSPSGSRRAWRCPRRSVEGRLPIP